MMSLDESKTVLLEVFDAAVRASGGEWDLKTDRVPSTCEDGEMYSLDGKGPAADDPRATADAVAAAWRELGYEVSMRDAQFGVVEVRYERDASGLYFAFGANDRVTDLDGTSPCVPVE
ncbi:MULTISPECIES: hypothetical protein [unclassified Salinibacterium]|uniref:hypothetical protein n=1 Tax=unclassified Salinibacterium TaxID=2632331 RepID=UPI0014233CFE|nr:MULTISPECIES: hypothetical protein [unclassified Salinibacterium]